MWMQFSSLAAAQVVILTTSGTASAENFINMNDIFVSVLQWN